MKGAVGIPQTIVHVKIMSIAIMNLMVVPAKISAILSNVRHAAEGSIQCGVKDCALPLASAIDMYRFKPNVPKFPRLLLYLVEAPPGHLSLQILLRLLRADVRETNTYLDLISSRTELLREETDVISSLVSTLRQCILLPCLVVTEWLRKLGIEVLPCLSIVLRQLGNSPAHLLTSFNRGIADNPQFRSVLHT